MPKHKIDIEATFLANDPIDYKEIPLTRIQKICSKGKVTEKELIADPTTNYITDELLKELKDDIDNNPDEKLSTIINIGVGQGKTRAIYDLVEYLDGKGDYIVMMVSPLKKLTYKDLHELKEERKLNVIHYEDPEKKETDIHLLMAGGSNIFITTINTLMNNPGDKNLLISVAKKNFSLEIIKKAQTEKKKVVMIFDEFHAMTEHFKSYYHLYLERWKDVVSKCYVLSATFSEASIYATEFITNITNQNTLLLYAKREKKTTQANLHFHITETNYSGNKKMKPLLNPVVTLLKEALTNDQNVHIITPYKDLASLLKNNKEINDALGSLLLTKGKKFNLLTSTTKDVFDEKQINIGTTFYTGIDIAEPNTMLIIIAPSANSKKENPDLGIYSNGLVAIHQAFGRLRNSGDIHFIAPPLTTFIKSKNAELLKTEGIISPISIETKSYLLKDQEQLIEEFYNHRMKELKLTASSSKGGMSDPNSLISPFPSLPQFTFRNGNRILALQYESFGKKMAPYVFYAGLHQQFTNCTLKSVTVYSYTMLKIKVTSSNIKSEIEKHIKTHGNIDKIRAYKSIHESYSELIKQLTTVNDHTEKELGATLKKVSFYFEDKLVVDFNKSKKIVKLTLLSIVFNIRYGITLSAEDIENEFILYSIKNAKELSVKVSPHYKKLDSLRDEFINEVNISLTKNKRAKPQILSHDLCYRILLSLRFIMQDDSFMKNKLFSISSIKESEYASAISEYAKTKKINHAVRNKVFRSMIKLCFDQRYISSSKAYEVFAERKLKKLIVSTKIREVKDLVTKKIPPKKDGTMSFDDLQEAWS